MTTDNNHRTRKSLAALRWIGVLAVFALVVLLARAATGALSGADSNPLEAEATVIESTTTTTTTATSDEVSPTTSVIVEPGADDVATKEGDPADEDDSSNPPTEESVDEETRLVVGEPTILPVTLQPTPDRIAIEPGVVINLEPYVAAQRSTGTLAGPNDGKASDSGISLDAPRVVDPVLGQPKQPLNVGVWVEPETSHLAAITIGVNPGPEGLAELTLDLGDGTTLSLDDRQLSSLRDGGVVEVVHRYEPTLTLQRQQVRASVRDNIGETEQSVVNFNTRAEFLIRFSPLTVTSLGDCDLFGKGDFELSWNIDGRSMSSEFKLGDGESFVEEDFSVGVSGFTFDSGYSILVSVRESDSVGVNILKYFADPFRGFSGPNYGRFEEIIELGTHVVPFSIVRDIGNSDCEVQLDFATTIAVDERADI